MGSLQYSFANYFFFFSPPDLFGANALCMQTVVSGTHVYEYCTSNDECLALLKIFVSCFYDIAFKKFFKQNVLALGEKAFYLFNDMHAL